MNKEILVTVICLTYNHEKYIRECIDGFVMQKTNFAYEVIIHDDASTDNTAEIIKQYQQQYPDIIIPILQTENQYSKKVPIGKTFIYPRARGKYIAFCEGDDYWIDQYKLQKQVDFLENNSDYVLSHTSFQYLIEYEGNRIQDFDSSSNINIHQIDENNIIAHILNYNEYRIQTATVLYRKNIFELIEKEKEIQNEPKFMMGDTPLWVRLCQYGKVHYNEDITTIYRQHIGSACRDNNKMKKLRFILSCSEMRVYFANLYSISPKYTKKFESAYKIDLFRYMLYDKTFTPIFKPHANTLEKFLLYDLILSEPFLAIIKPIYEIFSLQRIKNITKRIIKSFYK